MEVQNTYKVPRNQWRKWDQQQRALFNSVYTQITDFGPDLFLHPATIGRKHPLSGRKGMESNEFKTIAWNSAWVAADVLRANFAKVVHTIHNGEVIATDHVKRRAA